LAFSDSHYTLGGTVEADEIIIGGKQSLREIGEFDSNKMPFLIMVEENNHGGPRSALYPYKLLDINCNML